MTCIHFGLHCDGAGQAESSLGSITVGEQGLLTLLETQLGLSVVDTAFTDRLVQYLNCLESSLNSERFYADSFAADAFAAASALLSWRDQLYMSGWDGRFDAVVPKRLQDLADVEVLAWAEVAVNTGQRLQRIARALRQQSTQLVQIQLIDELELLPPLWQQLLCQLRDDHGIKLVDPDALSAKASAKSDLGKLQRALLADSAGEKLAFEYDGSIECIDAPAAHLAAQGVAEMFALYQRQTGELPQASLVAEQQGTSLDASFEHLGLPRPGYSSQSPWRPVFQLLQLAFEILWLPQDPQALLQFLTHPVGPLPRRLKTKLAELVAESPGIGSEQWHSIIQEYLDDLALDDKGKAKKLQASLSDWLDSELSSPEQGMAIELAIVRSELVADWLQNQHSLQKSKNDDASVEGHYALAHRQAVDLRNALARLKDSGRETLTREGIRLLIEQARGSGMGLVDRQAETRAAGNPIAALETPAAVLHSVPLVCWWGVQGIANTRSHPWLPSEKKALAENGINLWHADYELSLQASSWLRPFMNAEQQLILIRFNGSDRHHPVLDLVAAKLEDGLNSLAPKSLTDILSGRVDGKLLSVPISAQKYAVEPQALPEKQRWWQLNNIDLPKRDKESFSSLDKFINSPYQWVLGYHAKLRSSAAAQIQDEFRLKGTLAHSLFENFFNAHADIQAIEISQVKSWSSEQFEQLLPQSGATLLMPGHRMERERFTEQCGSALVELCQQLQSANVVSVEMELWQEGHFAGGLINGSIDILVKKKSGDEAVVDIKWAGYKKRKDRWSEGDYMQLATYAHLRKQAVGRYPVLGYFFINEQKLLSNNDEYFPQAELIADCDQITIASYWNDIENTWKWRRKQLDQGLIEVTVAGTEGTELSQPEQGLVIPECSDQYSDFTALTGWEQDA